MGCTCSKKETDKVDQFYDNERYKYLERTFKEQENNYLLVKVQSKYKGILLRREYKNLKNNQNKPILHINLEEDENKSTVIDSSSMQFNLELLNVVMKIYSPLNDGQEIEIKNNIAFDDGCIYYGEWKKGTNIKHGRGIQLWDDGTIYQGQFANNKRCFKGKLSQPDGNYYEGEFYDDKKQGEGKYVISSDGSYYKGNWHQDMQHGKGIECYADGSCFEGDYYYGTKTGKGKFSWGDGSIYEGDFNMNIITGKGNFLKKVYING